jgi:glycosyltransferase involved in cell wall biosynthesis
VGIQPLPKADSRRDIGLPTDVPVVCFIGFVHYDLELAVRAFAVVRRRLPDALLLLVGPRSRVVRTLKTRLDIGAAVIEAGVQPSNRVPVYLAASDVLLLPFGDRPCNVGRGPIKLGDYMAAGRPIVTNPVGEMLPLFREHAIGLLADETPEGFGGATLRLLQDPVLAESMGAEARRVAEERLSWDVVVHDLERCYTQVLRGRGTASSRRRSGCVVGNSKPRRGGWGSSSAVGTRAGRSEEGVG